MTEGVSIELVPVNSAVSESDLPDLPDFPTIGVGFSAATTNGPAARKRSGPDTGGISSDATPTLLALVEAVRVLREAVRDKTYRATALGQLVGRYVRWCRNERGLVDGTTIRDYEYTLARMALTLPRPGT